MFAYEQEVCLVYVVEPNEAETLAVPGPHGRCLDWNPESYADFIRVHPLADSSPVADLARLIRRRSGIRWRM